MKYIFFLSLFLLHFDVYSQGRFSIEANYGIQGNFFVRSYDEVNGPAPQNRKKNFVGTIGGIQLNYHFKDRSSVFAGYSHSVNKGRKNHDEVINGIRIAITDFTLRQNNDFFLLGYQRAFNKKTPQLKYDAGLFIINFQQQEIDILNGVNAIERNYKNYGMQEGGVFAGLEYSKPIDTHFSFGIKLRGYYLLSTKAMEAVSLTPVLRYHF